MKNTLKTLGIIAFVAVIIFSMAGCPDGNDKSGKSGTPTFTVTFDSADGSKVDPQTVTKGGKATKPGNPTKSTLMAGLWDKTPPEVTDTFNEWQKDGAAYDFDTPITDNITLTAQWTKGAVPSETPLLDTEELKELMKTSGQNNIISQSIRYIVYDYSDNSTEFTLVLEEDVDTVDEIGYFEDALEGVTLTITSTGTSERVISSSSPSPVLSVSNGTLVIDGNITLRGKNNKDNENPVVKVTRGSLELKGNAKITGNTSSRSAVALSLLVFTQTDYPSITMSGNAEISGNTKIGNGDDNGRTEGGGVSLDHANLTMKDNAAIKNNTASGGGGVSIGEKSTFTMDGGEINGNVGGGVFIYNYGKFIVASEAVKANIKGNRSGPQVKLDYGSTFTVGGVDAAEF